MENEDKNQEEKKQPAQSMWKELWDYAKIIIVVFVIAFLLGHFVYINARVPSGSMEQTIMTGDRVFGNRLAYKTKDPERFDIVIFKYRMILLSFRKESDRFAGRNCKYCRW